MLKQKRIWIPILSVLVLAMGCGLFYGQKVANQEPIKVYKPVDVQQPATPKPPPPGETAESGHYHGDEWHAQPHETKKLPLVDASDAHNPVTAPQGIGYPPLPPSAVPDDIPEHLKLPVKWKTGYYYGFSDGAEPDFSMAEAERLLSIIKEIIRDYNPRRPIGDIWHQFIEYEKMYRAYAEVDLNRRTFFGGVSFNRTDWQYEQTWAFPEIMKVVFEPTSEDERSLLLTARGIDMGHESPNWNEHILHDGRAFYLRGDTRYKFKWTTPEGVERTTGFSRTADPNAPVVVIYPDETSDEELTRLGWWNFHINPYTLQPVNYQPHNIKD